MCENAKAEQFVVESGMRVLSGVEELQRKNASSSSEWKRTVALNTE